MSKVMVWINRGKRGTVNLDKQIKYWEYKERFYRKMGWTEKANEKLDLILNVKLAMNKNYYSEEIHKEGDAKDEKK